MSLLIISIAVLWAFVFETPGNILGGQLSNLLGSGQHGAWLLAPLLNLGIGTGAALWVLNHTSLRTYKKERLPYAGLALLGVVFCAIRVFSVTVLLLLFGGASSSGIPFVFFMFVYPLGWVGAALLGFVIYQAQVSARAASLAASQRD